MKTQGAQNRCKQCNKKMNAVDWMISMPHGVCGDCCRKNHKEVIRKW